MDRFKPLILIFALLFTNSVFAEDSTEGATGSRIVGYGEDDHSTSSLEQMLEQPFVAAKVKNCLKYSNSTATPKEVDSEVIKCLWEKPEGLDDKEKEKVYEMLAVDKDDGEQYNSNLGNFKTEKSSAAKKLETYLGKKLEEALSKDAVDGGLKATSDHIVFYRLYRSQLGQNLIRQISSYCIYADEEGKFPSSPNEGDLNANKEKNLENLGKLTDEQDKSLAFGGFSKCIQNIGLSCQTGTATLGLVSVPDGMDVISSCELNRMMTSIKKSIEKTSDLIDGFKKINDGSRIEFRNANMTEVKVPELTNMGSKELVADSGYEEENRAIAESLKENCVGKTNAEKDENCKNFLTTKEENDAILNESDFRNRALASKVEHDIEESNYDLDTIKKVYKEQGLSDEEFEKLQEQAENQKNSDADCDTAEQCLANNIKARYENERDAINKALKAKLESTQYDPDNPDSAADKLDSLATKYEEASQNLAEIYQYANIVSAFIDVENEDTGEKMKNTAALSAELESNYFSASTNNGREDNTVDVRDLSELSQFSSDAGSDDTSDVNLSNTMVNDIQWGTGEKESANE